MGSRIRGDPGGLHKVLGGTCGGAVREWAGESRSRSLECGSRERVE